MRLESIESKEFIQKNYKYLISEFENGKTKIVEASMTGNLIVWKVDKSLIWNYPFEIAYLLDSTLGMIETLIRWNELLSCKKIKQLSFWNIFGLIISNFKVFEDIFIVFITI